MNNIASRIQEDSEFGPPEYQLEILLAVLNDEPLSGGTKASAICRPRFAKVVLMRFKRVESASEGYWQFFKKGHDEDLFSADYDYFKQMNEPVFSREKHRLHKTLSRYPMSLAVSVLPEIRKGNTELEWQTHWAPYRPPNRSRGFESRILQMIANMAAEARLASIRQCDYCGKWMSARRIERDHFCSSNCRILFNRNTPEQREARRKWARDNYQSRKELELGSRKAAQRKGRKK